jgi:hypothetical protein
LLDHDVDSRIFVSVGDIWRRGVSDIRQTAVVEWRGTATPSGAARATAGTAARAARSIAITTRGASAPTAIAGRTARSARTGTAGGSRVPPRGTVSAGCPARISVAGATGVRRTAARAADVEVAVRVEPRKISGLGRVPTAGTPNIVAGITWVVALGRHFDRATSDDNAEQKR